uniref:sialoadhesin-like isoform X2 n=1 Tax=Monopterus albus TaxID=43700 RepID=UPI0009B41A2F|nr:sialoadhesin-like isoform X2 [Monopterus albus]
MDVLKWPLLFVCFCFKVTQSEASGWTITVPSSVKGVLGSCAVIPCSFNYPNPGKEVNEFTGIWTESGGHVIYHPVQSKIAEAYRTRTELLGDTRHKNCSLKIDSLQSNDQRSFHFRIEIGSYDKYSYKDNTVTLIIDNELDVTFSVNKDVVEGQNVSASCSVFYYCTISPPVFTWNLSGEKHFQQKLINGQWKATSTLTFQPTKADNKTLQCIVIYRGGLKREKATVLNVQYAPVNVKADYKSDVQEGEAVQLKCSSDANPPVDIYKWHNETGAQLYQKNYYVLPNVSRHTGVLYCTAINRVGQGKSNPVQLNVLYAPEIKTISCSLEGHMMKCLCIAESNPPCLVYFAVSDKVLPSTKLDKHGHITIGTLLAESVSSEFVQCVANNTLGSADLKVSVNGKVQNLYIFIAIGACISVVVLLIAVIVVIKWRRPGDAPMAHMSATKEEKAVELPQHATTQRKQLDYNDIPGSGIYGSDHVYGNMEADCDDAIYANM